MRGILAAATFFSAFAIATITGKDAPATPENLPVPLVICNTFGRYCGQALRVSFCESRWHTDARNGQYLGLFQMGNYAREKYGHGRDAYSQSVAALRYFNATGKTWGPWTCKP